VCLSCCDKLKGLCCGRCGEVLEEDEDDYAR